MALYEYACSSCEHRFERIMKRGARAPRCPECGATTQRQISAPAIHFKGSGWAKKDAQAASKSKAASSTTDKDSKDGAKPVSEEPAKAADEGKKSDTAASASDTSTTKTTSAKTSE